MKLSKKKDKISPCWLENIQEQKEQETYSKYTRQEIQVCSWKMISQVAYS